MPFLGKSPTAGFASIVKDDLTPNGSTTAFTLSKQVANANDIAVFVGNVRQEPTDAYTVSGTTLTMTAAPASGVNFYVLHIAGTVESSVVPAAGTTVPGNFGVSGDLTVDTNTLHVDSANNHVGIGTSTDTAFSDLHIKTSLGAAPTNSSASGAIRLTSNAAAGVGVGPSILFRGQTGNSTAEYSFGSIQGVKSSSGTNDYSGDLVFYVQNSGGASAHSEKLRLLSAGGITFNGDTAAANALDDYEEGTWTPAFSSQIGTVSMNSVSGRYQRIGNFVTANFWINWTSITGNGSYGVQVTGLPFTSVAQIASERDVGLILGAGHETVPVLNSSYHLLGGYMNQNATTATFRMSGGGQSERSLDGSIAKGGGYIYGIVRYKAV